MSTCCKTTNLLRRDGTSQKQRFPIPLGESYVKIDERSHADILNFISDIAWQFNYYGSDNNIQADWHQFFSDDLSFVLAQTLKLDLVQYKATFEELYAPAAAEATFLFNPENTFDALDWVFRFFMDATKKPGVTYPAPNPNPVPEPFMSLPLVLSGWIDLMPDNGLYTSTTSYTFKDLLSDGRTRLLAVMLKLRAAHTESVGYGTTVDVSGWSNLENAGWAVHSNLLPPGSYFSTPDATWAEVTRVLQLVKTGFDTLVGLVENLQSQMPKYLEQSLKEFPWHNPQNALLLSFMQLFDHARDHLNTLTRRHLLYEYMDVLRFSKRPLTPDQAVVIMQLRKGTERYLLEAGTLLKAGKDVDGNPMHYAVSQETVVNQALITSLMNVFVEGITVDPDGEIQVNVAGIYASPVAKSADGLGAPLPENDPKWNLFGEAQLAKLEADRSMPDATLGFAVASPLFIMKEGDRVIDATFVVAADQLPALGADYSVWERFAVNIRQAFKAQYTTAKGWASAKISHVQLIDDQSKFNGYGLGPATIDHNNVALNFKVVLDEGDAPFVVYNEKVHKEGMHTSWPVLKLSFQGQSDDYSAIPITPLNAFVANNGVASHAFALYEGNIYYNTYGTTKYSLSDLKLIEDFETFWSYCTDALPYTTGTPYGPGDLVKYDGGIYRALAAVQDQNPSDSPHLWSRALRTYIYEWMREINPLQLLLRVDVRGAYGLLYENDFGKLKGEKPFPMFGGLPVVGSRFYIGSQEIFGKHLETLDIDLIWQDPPDNLEKHYEKYEPVVTELQTVVTGDDCEMVCTIRCTPGDFDSESMSEGYYAERQSGDMDYMMLPEELMEAEAEFYYQSYDKPLLEEQAPVCTTVCTCHDSSQLSNGAWMADISFLYDGQWEYLDRKPLFYQDANGNGARSKHTLSFPSSKFTAFDRDLNLSEHSRLESNTPRGFLRMELATPNIAFGHKYYKDLYVKAVQTTLQSDPVGDLDPPKEPYTPIVKEIRLHYVSKAVIEMEAAKGTEAAYDSRVDQYYHLHPFGHTEEHAYLQAGAEMPMLPQYTQEGELYIGIEGLQTPSTLSVLYQLAEGSGDADIDLLPAVWSVLQENRWHDLQRRDILLDTTDDLITSGVIQYDFDSAFMTGNTLLPQALHWLRVRVPAHTLAYMRGIDIVAQAVIVNFQDAGNNPAHLVKALPAETINGLVISDPAVKKVSQPYGSFGGKLPEQGDTFLTRVSERLRHKQRSINVWDYERMVLEEFPSIYKVKCLNHTEYKAVHTDGKDWEISPGHVMVVCIPDLRNLNSVNPFEPKTSIRIIQQVDAYLRRFISAWVDLKVKNPLYESIQINCKVGFVKGKDPGYYTQVLERSIQEFLSPWAFDHSQEIVFGGKVHRSKVIQLIEQQDYVDFVVDFSMDHRVGDEVNTDVTEAVATTGRSILVSALDHLITSVKPSCELCVPGEEAESLQEPCCGPH